MCDDTDDLPTDPVLPAIERFLRASGMSAATFGMLAGGDKALVYEIRKGRDLRRATRARIRAFISAEMAD